MIEVSALVADRYRIDARIGGGGMADVFEARDVALDRDVAIKLLRGIDDPAAARRFAEEIRLTARLNHPNVVQLFDAGEHDGSPFLVLERVTGGTLAQAMDDGGMAPELVAEIGRQTAAALEHAHAEGIVHRDVKPSNILLTEDGTVRLADFGIALTATATRLTVAGSVAGSAGYVSPEQVLGTGAGAPSDVYALGLVLLECLTGAPPWSGTTVEVALARITADPPIPASVPDSWRGLITAMTARNPEHRPPMGAVVAGLAALAQGRETALFPIPVAPRPRRRWRVPVAAVSATLLLGAAALLSLEAQSPPDTEPAPTAAAVTPDGVIAASAVGGAAAGVGTPAVESEEETAASDSEDEAERRRTRRPRSNATGGGTTADAPAASTGGGGAAPEASAPARQQAPSTTQDRERTRTTTRDTTTTSPDSGGDSGTDSGGDTSDETNDDTTSDDEVADTTPKGNNGKAKGAKSRGPTVEDLPSQSSTGVLK